MYPHEVKEEIEKLKPVSSDYSIVQINYLEINGDSDFISKVQETNHLEEFKTPPISTIDWVAIDKEGEQKQLGATPSIDVENPGINSTGEAIELLKQNEEASIKKGLEYFFSTDELGKEDQRRCSKHVSKLLDYPNESIRNRAALISGLLRNENSDLGNLFVEQLSEIASDEERITLAAFSYGYAANRNTMISGDIMDILVEVIDSGGPVEATNQLLALKRMTYKYPEITGLGLDRVLDVGGSSNQVDKGVFELVNTLAFHLEELPSEVEDDLLGLLGSSEEGLRELACYSLGYLDLGHCLDELRRVRDSDSSEDVRESAHRAVMWIEQGGG